MYSGFCGFLLPLWTVVLHVWTELARRRGHADRGNRGLHHTWNRTILATYAQLSTATRGFLPVGGAVKA